MDLSAAVTIAKYIVQKVADTRDNDADIKGLAGHVHALQPQLESLVARDVRASCGVVEQLVGSLSYARDLVDRVTAMRGPLERFVRSAGIKDDLAIAR
jgi:hypothetical protein